jgi:Ariadne domain
MTGPCTTRKQAVRAGNPQICIPVLFTTPTDLVHRCSTGFFRCNRWVDQKDEHEYYDAPPEDPQAALNVTNEDLSDPNTMAITYGTAIHASLVARKRQKEMARFLHHYQRWSAHAESASLESKMGDTAQRRLAPVVKAAAELDGRPDFNFDGEGLSFVYDAFAELLECRSMLQHSYAHSYFRYDLSPIKRSRALKRRMTEKAAFEQIQAELEMLTEQLSNVVARSRTFNTQASVIVFWLDGVRADTIVISGLQIFGQRKPKSYT